MPKEGSFSTLSVLDASGKMVQKNIASSTTNYRLDINHLPKGWYVLKLIGEENEQKSFIKN